MALYSRNYLFSLAFWWKSAVTGLSNTNSCLQRSRLQPLSPSTWSHIKSLGILRSFRGKPTRRPKPTSNIILPGILNDEEFNSTAFTDPERSYDRNMNKLNPIQVRITRIESPRTCHRTVDYRVLTEVKCQQKTYDIPTILSTNIRSIATKLDELQQLATLNKAGAICITESWLSPNIPDSCVSMPGFNIFRKDRTDTTGGGICIYLDQKIPCKLLQSCDQNNIESLWLSIRPYSLPRSITSIILGVVYHSTRNRETENNILRDHIQKNLDTLPSKQPNALAIVTGYFNPTTTGLRQKAITQPNNLRQLVTFKTRDSGTLDWFLTNKPKIFNVSQLPKIDSSDRNTILANPITLQQQKPSIRKIKTRDMRYSAWRAIGRWIIQKDWNHVPNALSCEDKYNILMSDLNKAIDTFLPERTVKKNTQQIALG